ncbi:MAG: BrnA antitoxin family protein [Ottowia sp.]|nr:BrnA antitoxin family protein [Ottowia sp.]
MTAEQQARLAALAALPDECIDTSDAPPRPDAVWRRAAGAPAHGTQPITLHLDADVLEFFKNTGQRYQSRINAVLRSYVEAHKVGTA